ncbi:heavy-metal-associated domain-containing protein [Gaetbulibacter saemankumensis]|uniref:heavy-metal-associated domain-containing protein n=1 Tax=Gaetbulibacter saemankumensis TaxID=311208 RepID=UPI00047FD765|nr:cation transporter [Gaetbulibacter saemankumensis]
MKQVFLSVAIVMAMGLTSCKNEAKQSNEATAEVAVSSELTQVTFGVRGNCGMCKKTIETAANAVDGVEKAVWDVDKKQIAVAFDASKTNMKTVHEAIAASGYDTDKFSGSETAYENLPGCCQYDHSMEMAVTK